MEKNNKSDSLVKKALKLDPSTEGEAYIDFLKKAIDEDFANLKPHVLLGYYYYKNKNSEDAAEHLQDAVKIDCLIGSDVADASNVYLTLGKIYRNLGKKEESLSYYKDFIGLFPYSSKAETLASQIYVKLKNFDEWYSTYKKASDFYKKGDYAASAKNFRNCQKWNQSFLWSSFFLSRALMHQGNFSEAEEILAKISKQRSYYVYKYYYYLVKKELTSQGDITLLREIRTDAPYFLEAAFEEAEYEAEEKHYEKAIELCDLILKSSESDLKDKAKELKDKLERESSSKSKAASSEKAESSSAKGKSGEPRSSDKDREDLINDAIKEAENITLDAYNEAKMIKSAAEKEAEKIKNEAREYAKGVRTSADSGSLRNRDKSLGDAVVEAEKIKESAKNEAEEILRKAKESAIHLETAPATLPSPAIDKEMALRKRRELEERYDKMVQELAEERKRLRYKALDDSEELLKSTEKHRSEIVFKAQEDAETIIKTASMMSEKERRHIYDKTLKYSVAAIEEARKKALDEADLILSRTKDEAASIISATKNFADKNIESILSLADEVKKKFLERVNDALSELILEIRSSGAVLRQDFSLADVNAGVSFAENAASLYGEFDDSQKVSTEVTDNIFNQDTETNFPAASEIVADTVKDSEESSSFNPDTMQEDGMAESKEDFLDRFVSDSELSAKPAEPEEKIEPSEEEELFDEDVQKLSEDETEDINVIVEQAEKKDEPFFPDEPSLQENIFGEDSSAKKEMPGSARKTTQIEGFFIPDTSSETFFDAAPSADTDKSESASEQKDDIFAVWDKSEPSPFSNEAAMEQKEEEEAEKDSNVDLKADEEQEQTSGETEKSFGSFLSKFMDDDDE